MGMAGCVWLCVAASVAVVTIKVQEVENTTGTSIILSEMRMAGCASRQSQGAWYTVLKSCPATEAQSFAWRIGQPGE